MHKGNFALFNTEYYIIDIKTCSHRTDVGTGPGALRAAARGCLRSGCLAQLLAARVTENTAKPSVCKTECLAQHSNSPQVRVLQDYFPVFATLIRHFRGVLQNRARV